MSPEVAASIVQAVPCPYCGAREGSRCFSWGAGSRLRSTPHQQRILADLFRKAPR